MKINLTFRKGGNAYELKGINDVCICKDGIMITAPAELTKTVINEFMRAGLVDWFNFVDAKKEIQFELYGCEIKTINVIEL